MPRRLTFNPRARAAGAFALLAGISLAALAWFGRTSLDQERDLTRLVLAERLTQTATLISAEVDADLVRWEGLAGTGGEPGALPSGVTMIRFNPSGVTEVNGERLPYYPAVPAFDMPDDERLRVAQRAELNRDLNVAIATYQDAATSTVRAVKATALAGLGRCLWLEKRTVEALDAYEDLARAADARVAGVPAVLIARRERQAIYAGMGDTVAADLERDRLAQELRAATHLIDRATFDALASVLTAGAIPKSLLSRADTLVDFWPRWQQAPSGRIVGGAGPDAVVAIWRSGSNGSTAIIGPVDMMLASSFATAQRLSVSMAIERASGETVSGDVSSGDGAVVLSLAGIGLSATLRVFPPAEAERTNTRELLFIAAFVLLAAAVAMGAYAARQYSRRR